MNVIPSLIVAAIGMIGVYIAFALLVSWLQEQLAGIAGLRSKTLILGLRQLIADDQDRFARRLILTVGEPFTISRPTVAAPTPQPVQTLTSEPPSPSRLATLVGLPYVKKFFDAELPSAEGKRFPSYVSSRDFVSNLMTYVGDTRLLRYAAGLRADIGKLDAAQKALLPVAVVEAADAESLLQALRANADALYALVDAPRDANADVPSAVASLVEGMKRLTVTGTITANAAGLDPALEAAIAAMPKPLRDVLMARLRDAGGDYARFIASLEQWYDDYMQRVSGWYKRCATLLTIYLSCAVVLIFNVDSIAIARTLADNSELSKSLALFSVDLGRTQNANGSTPSVACPNAVAGRPCSDCPAGYVPGASATCVIDLSALRGLPFGYPDRLFMHTVTGASYGSCTVGTQCGYAFGAVAAVVLKTAGWMLTVVALSLGAPFWFDLLGFLVNVRNAGATPALAADLHPATATAGR